MAEVPLYDGLKVKDRPILQSSMTVRASPDDMGAAIGRGLQDVGQGIGQVSKALAAVQALEDETIAKERDNQYSAWLREDQFGPNGYLTKEGKAAVDARADFEKRAAEARAKFGEGLRPGAAKLYKNASEARLNSTLDRSIVHSAGERKKWVNDTANARLDTFSEDALAGYKNPKEVEKNIQLGLAELRNNGELNGVDGEVLANQQKEFVSGVRKNVVMRMAQDDPIAADKYYQDHKGQFTGPHQYDVETGLHQGIVEEKGKRAADDYIQKSTTRGNLRYTNSGATRNRKLQPVLERNIGSAVAEVYGPGYRVEVFSGGQPGKGEKGKRTGTTRHDHGNAADVYVVGPDGKRLTGDALGPLAQYWLAKGLGGVGLEMKRGGIHLDNHTDRAKTWNYATKGGRFTIGQLKAVRSGLKGQLPNVNGQPPAAGPDAPVGDMETYLANIPDEDVRDHARKRIAAFQTAQNRVSEETTKLAKAELWKAIDAGLTPDDVPYETRMAAGMDATSSAWTYYEKRAKGTEVETDEALLYQLSRNAANDPETFSKLDLNDYRDKLSKGDIRSLAEKQTGFLGDKAKAANTVVSAKDAYAAADTRLEALGLTTTGKTGAEREDTAKRIARFQNALQMQIEEYRKMNSKEPGRVEVDSMINRLLLPTVHKKEKSFWSTEGFFSPMSPTVDEDGHFLFEADGRPDGTTVDVVVTYDEIPHSMRSGIRLDLERELGRPVSNEEVVTAYETYVLTK